MDYLHYRFLGKVMHLEAGNWIYTGVKLETLAVAA